MQAKTLSSLMQRTANIVSSLYKRYSGTGMNFAQPLYAKAQQASKIYTRSALTYKISILFRFDYSIEKFRIIGLFTRERLGFINKKRHDIAISCLFYLSVAAKRLLNKTA